MSELACLELSIVLWIAHIVVQAAFAGSALSQAYLASPRDQKREPRGVYYGRATRALANYVENLGPFVAADLGLIATQHTGGWGAAIWIVARIAYIPLYVYGVPRVRSLAWVISIVGLLMMLARLAGF
jgi:uncharacterized MAPEG superfamily protein